ncbi:hypothetical protein CANARDRAFT_8424 [[Candida] arabinofermentans NRRL YB-2248]|uniref:Threonylcarbamoyl-AMP synthase n=1 Tax=[Candida] arabinofermentans NRRL YB-2248 TaxID=983967 RepID=A0A1E4SZB7_9ASCO|nr:hypothetical protein CANARDRAFT_8424 [[Candida] arabinofermentans NRRL YB-2248]
MTELSSAASQSFDTKVLKVDPASIAFNEDGTKLTITDPVTQANLEEAAQILTTTNNVVGFPTETVYGLGGSSLNSESVKSIYRAKNRPSDNPLISHVSSIDQLKRKLLSKSQTIPDIYLPLITKFWPGPLTILLPALPDSPISPNVTANQPTFAVRMPSHPIARALIAISDTPLAAPSANASTRPSPTTAQHVYHDLQSRIPLILDGGSCDVGLESTVVDGLCSPPMLLRPGGISLEDIRKAGGAAWEGIVVSKKTAGKLEPVRTPGMKYRHYSPTAKVVLFLNCGDGVDKVHDYIEKLGDQKLRIALLRSKYFKKGIDKQIVVEEELGVTGDEIQRNLFALMRKVDEMGVDYILIEGVDENNEGLAIMNRLSKAASETIVG